MSEPTRARGLLVLWEWPHDRSIVRQLLGAAAARGIPAEAVGPARMAAALHRFAAGAAVPALVLDRASDSLPDAAALARLLKRRGARVVNDPDRTAAAADKARMHLALMAHGIAVPWTLVLPPLQAAATVSLDGLRYVGTPFVVKPAHGGGGEGVVLDAASPADIETARGQWAHDRYLVQERIQPLDLDGDPAWFRVLYVLGDVHPCFWHPRSGVYRPLTAAERIAPWARGLDEVTRTIAQASGMALFSTEVALTAGERLVAVDYVNDMCDLRSASGARDGVPDVLVAAIAARLVAVAGGATAEAA